MNEKTLQKSAELLDVQMGQFFDTDGVLVPSGKYILKKSVVLTPVIVNDPEPAKPASVVTEARK
jgi:hypothetical protein